MKTEVPIYSGNFFTFEIPQSFFDWAEKAKTKKARAKRLDEISYALEVLSAVSWERGEGPEKLERALARAYK